MAWQLQGKKRGLAKPEHESCANLPKPVRRSRRARTGSGPPECERHRRAGRSETAAVKMEKRSSTLQGEPTIR